MTGPAPALLLDTCSIINLSYCSPVATLFKQRYAGRTGWARAVQAELLRQRSRKPPHPQAGRAGNWAASWLPSPIDIVDEPDQAAVEDIQHRIALGSDDDNLDHLGEAASIHLLTIAGSGRLISDDHGARAVARAAPHHVNASSTVGVLSELLSRQVVTAETVDLYLEALRKHERMRIALTASHLVHGELASWA
ncbi:MAG TPA: hypothetical protein VF661_13835 [Actinomycetales bacterium]